MGSRRCSLCCGEGGGSDAPPFGSIWDHDTIKNTRFCRLKRLPLGQYFPRKPRPTFKKCDVLRASFFLSPARRKKDDRLSKKMETTTERSNFTQFPCCFKQVNICSPSSSPSSSSQDLPLPPCYSRKETRSKDRQQRMQLDVLGPIDR